jgi:hypothetical protein
MTTQKNISECIKWAVDNIKGNISEKIIQNAMVYKLRNIGIECQQEVVLPVLTDGNVFLGYNRFDIFIPSTCKKHITIIKLKLLSNSIKKNFIGSRIQEQCSGYKECAHRIFGDSVNVKVFLVNTWRTAGKPSPYEHEIIEARTNTKKIDKTPKNITRRRPVRGIGKQSKKRKQT